VTKRIVILGGGPAGYVAALRAAQLGASVSLVEAREIGGTCLNRGCIPTKALVAAAGRLRQARAAAHFGIVLGEPRVDFGALLARKAAVVAQQRGGVEHLLKGR
jgi:dihydrolipoamide dehydrogenase